MHDVKYMADGASYFGRRAPLFTLKNPETLKHQKNKKKPTELSQRASLTNMLQDLAGKCGK